MPQAGSHGVTTATTRATPWTALFALSGFIDI